MCSASAFGSADNTFLDLDYSGYHKNLIQYFFIISRMKNWNKKNVRKGFRVLTSDHFRDFGFYFLRNFDFHFWWGESENRKFSSPFFIIMVCEHEQPEELGNSINLFYNQLKLLQSIYWEWYWVRVHWKPMKILLYPNISKSRW